MGVPESFHPDQDAIAGELLLSLINDMELLLAFEQSQRVAHFQPELGEKLTRFLVGEYRQRLERLARLVEDKDFLRLLLLELGAMERPDLQDYLRSVFGYRHELQEQLQIRGVTESDAILKEYVSGKYRRITQELPPVNFDQNAYAAPEIAAEADIYRRRTRQLAELLKQQQQAMQTMAETAAAMLSLFVNYLNDRVNQLPPEDKAARHTALQIAFGELEAPTLQMARKLKAIEQSSGKPCGYAEVMELISKLFARS
ncbi:hypothetical protein [Chloracidobacterium aggregatum]|jgi:hypothetical protein|uniref:Uncharacterized protein n=1 Tax=Chloracidobacterium sp. N TaxID=2821540 RepID=A0ABX8B051_9BACT|nr:hypothetical protein [Chloracidobacterium aggregatum]QUV84158.1 hypothetical protein J8C03_08380 [Chloracidobacterium sp. 2]QUV87357.1 hypothetical protein J8C07_09260 [Chloracidobacterium sp. S]QUV90261.1 hypothetical protein J8C04_08265 [Chloracidobacterium sp. A]QUV93472.1 hypothetical protein J8C05_08845 [Chloracidobacterium sp. N]QUV96628.1 hypothetical protein J8C00_09990 [Chloracidobacterium sp. E]